MVPTSTITIIIITSKSSTVGMLPLFPNLCGTWKLFPTTASGDSTSSYHLLSEG